MRPESIQMDDRKILDLVQSGRRDDAARELLIRFRRKVFSLVFAMLRDRAHAEDVTQEVFIRVWQKLHAFDRRASLATWIFQISRNAAISALRSRKSQAQLSERFANELSVHGTEVPALDEAGHDASAVTRLVDALPEPQRTVVILFYMQERCHQDVAELLDMPIGTVKTLLHRARGRLAAAVASAAEDVSV